MKIETKLFSTEVEELTQLLSGNTWPYHSNPKLKSETIKKQIENGYYSNGRETFWIITNDQKIGLIIIDDIDDTIPLFDIRLTKTAQGKGIGVQALNWLKDYLFGEKKKIRIEGYTRADNLPMRKCFTKAGFVKEGYLRNAWENKDGSISDSVLYAAIFEDWKTKTITPNKIYELPF